MKGDVARARDALANAVSKSRGSNSEDIVRAIANACLYEGLHLCAGNLVLLPVKFSFVSQYIQDECPDEEFEYDWYYTDEECNDEFSDDVDRYNSYGAPDEYGQYDINGYFVGANGAQDTAEKEEDQWTLTDLLETNQCQRYFTVVYGPEEFQPQVVAYLGALIQHPHITPVQHILSELRTIKVHSKDAGYKAAYKQCLIPLQQPAAASNSSSNAQVVLVTSIRQAKEVCSSAKLIGRVGFDCEGRSLSKTGHLCLVQVQVKSTCYLFDVLQADGGIMALLKLLLEDPAVVKVVHDCRHDSAALFHQKGIDVKNLFDTQVAYGLTGLWEGMISGQHPQSQQRISLSTLLAKYNLPTKGLQDVTMKQDNKAWKQRSLTHDMIQCAAGDVFQLLHLADKLTNDLGNIHLKLVQSLSRAHSQWHRATVQQHNQSRAVASPESLIPFGPGSWLGQLFVKAKIDQEQVSS